MSRHEPLGGDAHDAAHAQEGNRPAQNARLTTPGSLSTQGYQGGDGAADFLGLEAEVGGNAGAFAMMVQANAVPEPEAAPEPSAWVETDRSRARSDDLRETAIRRAQAARAQEQHDEGDEAELHGSWSEDAPKRSGNGKLVGAAAGVLVLGLLGVAGMKFMDAAADQPAPTQPVTSNARPRPAQGASLVAPVAVEDGSASERSSVDGPGAATAEPAPESAVAGSSATPVDPQSARETFEETRGDVPPVWFDPTLDSQGEPASTGWSEEAQAVTRASTFVGDPIALLVAEALASEPALPATTPLTAEETSPVPIASPTALVAVSSEGSSTTSAPTDNAASSSASSTAASTSTSAAASAPVVVAAAPSTGTSIGPTAPAGDTLLPADGAVAAFTESRQSRTSSLKVEDVLLAPTMDSTNLRQADAKDLSGVWSETSVPMQAMGSKTKVLTPNVGRVRVILTSKDIFEGKLYAVGQGSVWLESEYGRISVDGKRIASVANIDTKEGTPALGSNGSQNLNGLERVRIKTPGGTFYGKVIARDETQTTVITEEGSRLTLSNANVEILTDAPKVTIGGKVEETPKQP